MNRPAELAQGRGISRHSTPGRNPGCFNCGRKVNRGELVWPHQNGYDCGCRRHPWGGADYGDPAVVVYGGLLHLHDPNGRGGWRSTGLLETWGGRHTRSKLEDCEAELVQLTQQLASTLEAVQSAISEIDLAETCTQDGLEILENIE